LASVTAVYFILLDHIIVTLALSPQSKMKSKHIVRVYIDTSTDTMSLYIKYVMLFFEIQNVIMISSVCFILLDRIDFTLALSTQRKMKETRNSSNDKRYCVKLINKYGQKFQLIMCNTNIDM